MTALILPDVNVLVASIRSDHPHHQRALEYMVTVRNAGDRVITPVEVLASALRMLTLNVWFEPETSESAAGLVRAWIDAADAEVVSHPPQAWVLLAEFARTLDLSTRHIPDALLAGSAIALRAVVASFDRGLERYPGLRTVILRS